MGQDRKVTGVGEMGWMVEWKVRDVRELAARLGQQIPVALSAWMDLVIR